MFNSPLAQSIITFILRRGLTLLGTAGAQVSEEWVTQTASLVLIAGNEIYQYAQAHKAAKKKANP